jgi:hypothetical protein
MFKAWLIVLIWSPSPDYQFLEKVEVPFRTMTECRLALKDPRTGYSPVNRTKKYCVTNSHYEGTSIDKDVPLEPSPK